MDKRQAAGKNYATRMKYKDISTKYNEQIHGLIAYALKHHLMIVIDEQNKGPNGSPTNNEPKIPFVAQHFNVTTIDFWDFLSREHFKAQ